MFIDRSEHSQPLEWFSFQNLFEKNVELLDMRSTMEISPGNDTRVIKPEVYHELHIPDH